MASVTPVDERLMCRGTRTVGKFYGRTPAPVLRNMRKQSCCAGRVLNFMVRAAFSPYGRDQSASRLLRDGV